MSNSIPIAVVEKNRTEEVRISLDVMHGRRLFNTRVYYEADDGTKRPGKPGLALRLECLESFAEAVTSALMTAKAKGYLK